MTTLTENQENKINKKKLELDNKINNLVALNSNLELKLNKLITLHLDEDDKNKIEDINKKICKSQDIIFNYRIELKNFEISKRNLKKTIISFPQYSIEELKKEENIYNNELNRIINKRKYILEIIENEINDLIDKKVESNKNLSNLKIEKDKLECNIKNLSRDIQIKRHQIISYQREKQKIRKCRNNKLEEINKQINKNKIMIINIENELKLIPEEKRKINNKYWELKTELDNNNNELNITKKEIEKLVNQINELNTSNIINNNNDKELKIKELNIKLKDLWNKRDSLINKIKKIESSKEINIDKLNDDIDNKKKYLEEENIFYLNQNLQLDEYKKEVVNEKDLFINIDINYKLCKFKKELEIINNEILLINKNISNYDSNIEELNNKKKSELYKLIIENDRCELRWNIVQERHESSMENKKKELDNNLIEISNNIKRYNSEIELFRINIQKYNDEIIHILKKSNIDIEIYKDLIISIEKNKKLINIIENEKEEIL
jgi:hypothetical protein